MKFIAISGLFLIGLLPAFTQTTKPPAKPRKVNAAAVSKATPASTRKPAAAKATTAKAAAVKPNAAKRKPDASPSAAKAKPKPASQRPVPKTTTAKARPAATPKPKPKPKLDETAEWTKAVEAADRTTKLELLNKFVAAFPKSSRIGEAAAMIVENEIAMGDEAIQAGNNADAVNHYLLAAAAAPSPMPDAMFTANLAKLPSIVYWKGERDAALRIVNSLESKASAPQLLTLATFFLTVENGTEASRLAQKAIAIAPDAAGYQVLGLAERMDFRLDESAAAYQKAVDLDAASLNAKRGLAEAQRSLGRSSEAATLYRSILDQDPSNSAAETGLILALFEDGKADEANAILTRSLEANAGNVVLLAGVAYWNAAHGNADKAIEYARRAIDAEPRFIWSHIALARGLMLKKDPLEAERVLIGARRYGNFPTLEYELASARSMAGFYREAAEDLRRNFWLKDGAVATRLGGRIERSSDGLTELISFERRASIFAPTAADDPVNSSMLKALLGFAESLDQEASDGARIAAAADAFTASGDDAMKVHRQIFAASRLIAKNAAPEKVIDLMNSAAAISDAATNVATPTVTVIADELYGPRAAALARNETLRVKDVPVPTLKAIVRGRIEELSGAALLLLKQPADAVIRFRRSLGILPADSTWWRSSMWRLGSANEAENNTEEALKNYTASYKAGPPDTIKYAAIRSLYIRTKGSADGLEALVGADPDPTNSTAVAANLPQPPATGSPTPSPEITPVPAPTPVISDNVTAAAPTPMASPVATPETAIAENIDPAAKAAAAAAAEAKPSPSPSPSSSAETAAVPADDKEKPKSGTDLFPPVVITVPPVETPSPSPTPSASPTPDQTGDNAAERPRIAEEKPGTPAPCKLTASETALTLPAGGELAVIIGTEDDRDLADLTAAPSSSSDISVRAVPISGVSGRSLFLVKSLSTTPGLYQIKFALPCGTLDMTVTVR